MPPIQLICHLVIRIKIHLCLIDLIKRSNLALKQTWEWPNKSGRHSLIAIWMTKIQQVKIRMNKPRQLQELNPIAFNMLTKLSHQFNLRLITETKDKRSAASIRSSLRWMILIVLYFQAMVSWKRLDKNKWMATPTEVPMNCNQLWIT